MLKINLLKPNNEELNNIEKVFSVNLKEGLIAHIEEIKKHLNKGYGARLKGCKSIKDNDGIVVGYNMTINFYK